MRVSLILVGVLCASCSPQRGAPTGRELFPSPVAIEAVVAPNPTPPPEPVPEIPGPPEDATAIGSNGGTYIVFITPTPTTLPTNQPIHLDLWVTERMAPKVTLSNIELAFSAAIPETGHGLGNAPTLIRAPDEHFIVGDLVLDMPGHWQLHFDITRDSITERAQIDVVVE